MAAKAATIYRCPKCWKVCSEVKRNAPLCLVVKAQREADGKARKAAYEAQKEGKAQRKLRSASDDVSDSASTADTDAVSLAEEYNARQSLRRDAILLNAKNGRLALSPEEEREARKIEKKLRDIEGLLRLQAQGKTLEKNQLAKIQAKDSLESSLVMRKIRAGAERPAPAPAAPQAARAQAPDARVAPAAPVSALAPALPPSARNDGASLAKVPTKPEGIPLSQMVEAIRGELGLDGALTMSEVIAEANIQAGLPATGNLGQQASSLFRELISA